MIAHQIQTIQRAIQVFKLQYSSRTQKLYFLSKTFFLFQAKLSSLNFEDSDIKINAGCAVFVTTESLQEESKNIPDNLKVRYLYNVFYFMYLEINNAFHLRSHNIDRFVSGTV